MNDRTILVITNRPLSTFSNGYDLRVWHLCRALKEHNRLLQLVVPLSLQTQEHADLHPQTIFERVVTVPGVAGYQGSMLRHFRLTEADLYRWGYPRFQQSVEEMIDKLCGMYAVDKIIIFNSDLAGLVYKFAGRKKILLDVCDSAVLNIERACCLDRNKSALSILKSHLMLARWKRLEGKIPHWCDHVTTINDADTETVIKLSGGCSNISTIPNGVDPAYESAYQEKGWCHKGVVFWGNLSFAPNRDAVQFFYHKIYLPYFKPNGIEWCIVGRDAENWLMEAAKGDEKIRLTGYVQDLRALLVEYPVMVNPMRIGSGMKNKVLEAFSLGLAVVSTSLGMESIKGAVTSKDFMLADNPQDFANAVFKLLQDEDLRTEITRSARKIVLNNYTWDIVGCQWLALINSL